MALTGLDIFKLLPKTNCGKCKSPTCLAFAMQVASKKASLDMCPDVSEQAKAALGAASAPPIKLVTIGTGENKLEIGNETVMFRHEEKFHHPTGFCVEVDDAMPDAEMDKALEEINRLKFERVAMHFKLNLVAIREKTGDGQKFADAVKKVSQKVQAGLVFISEKPEVLEPALQAVSGQKPLIGIANKANADKMSDLAKKYGCPLIVSGTIDELAELTQSIGSKGVSEMVLSPARTKISGILADLVAIRRMALKKQFRPFGYPAIVFASASTPAEEMAQAEVFVCKYAGIVVLKFRTLWEHLALVTARLNIYTDPQKPIQVEPKLYEIGTVSRTSPVLITTNFSLTYFTVEGEVEASRVPSRILVVNTEGTSVLTAWAADKFNADVIADTMKKTGIEGMVDHKNVVIPGGVAVISSKLQEKSGWKVLVGPREASGIPSFLKGLK